MYVALRRKESFCSWSCAKIFLGFIVILIGIGYLGTTLLKPSPLPPPASKTTQKIEPSSEEKKKDYLDRVEATIEIAQNFNVRNFLGSEHSVFTALGIFEYWAGLRKEGQAFNFNQAEKALYDKLKEATSTAQKKAFPILRDAFGPILREMLWENDITAKTFGTGYHTVEFVGGLFAANRNIKQFYEATRIALDKLRFKQARFKWFKEASEYTYYTITGPKDDELVVWGSDDHPQVIL